MDLLLELIRVLPKNGEWKFKGQKEKWLEAASLLVDMEMDSRKEQKILSQIKDVGPCDVIIISVIP